MLSNTKTAQRYELSSAVAYVRAAIGPAICDLATLANYDLHYGPTGSDADYPGFMSAIAEITAALDAAGISDLWVEGEYVTDREPQGFWHDDPQGEQDEWIEPEWDEIYHYRKRDVLKATFGALAEYL